MVTHCDFCGEECNPLNNLDYYPTAQFNTICKDCFIRARDYLKETVGQKKKWWKLW